jgi:hypothetical protein
MTEPNPPRPVPGPGGPAPGTVPSAPGAPADGPGAGDRLADLADRPVPEHVEVFEAEHDRLQAELGTIDRV